jgi:hypothetical protein
MRNLHIWRLENWAEMVTRVEVAENFVRADRDRGSDSVKQTLTTDCFGCDHAHWEDRFNLKDSGVAAAFTKSLHLGLFRHF